MKKLLVILSAAAILSGCVSIEYTGKTVAAGESDTKIAVFTDSSKITRKYEVLGQATARGNYQEVSRDRMISKLRQKAAESGANAILIVEHQVISDLDEASTSPAFMTALDYDETEGNWKQIYTDVNRDFVNTRRNRTSTTSGSANHFTRVIRAEFLRWQPEK
ncbi:MAG: membrane lipoprotein lipid attachment site-containing protein [Lentisphaeria bacterium]|nr:membrane lipoprotein lipid attachment site-containing protein [Lentisphaeria bacterium]